MINLGILTNGFFSNFFEKAPIIVGAGAPARKQFGDVPDITEEKINVVVKLLSKKEKEYDDIDIEVKIIN